MHTDDTGQQGGDSAGNGLLSRRQWMQIGAGTAAAAVVAPVVARDRLGRSPGAAVPERRHRTMAIAQVCRRCVVSKSRFILLGRKPVRHQRPATAQRHDYTKCFAL